MKVAIQGCCHGELDNIYATIEGALTKEKIQTRPDVLICCGDFQSIRNLSDLHTYAAPPKYKKLGQFYQYYNGEKVAPILTIFIGGNHEASAYLWELFYGGWVAPNIYFLGFAGSVILRKTLNDGKIESLRISGASGIYKRNDYNTGHHERLPFDGRTLRSIYHIREYDIHKVKLLSSTRCDIFLSHDWPYGIERYGDINKLLRDKPFFKEDIDKRDFGSPPLLEVLNTLRPRYWFSAHLHVRFPAIYPHSQVDQTLTNAQPSTSIIESSKKTKLVNPDELQIVDDSEEGEEEDKMPINPIDDGQQSIKANNPDQIVIDDSDEDMKEDQQRHDKSNPDQTLIYGSHKREAKSLDGSLSHGKGKAYIDEQVNQKKSKLKPDQTKFLALDKCLPNRDFLQILEIKPEDEMDEFKELFDQQSSTVEGEESNLMDKPKERVTLNFDPNWLAITRALDDQLPLTKQRNYSNNNNHDDDDQIKLEDRIRVELDWVKKNLKEFEIGKVQRFIKTAPGIGDQGGDYRGHPLWYSNPQTISFTNYLMIENKINPIPK
ncbi:lariat debranching enzyme, C-terminal domain-domain-containing protein, partial [Phakopsora pachyrhizi]